MKHLPHETISFQDFTLDLTRGCLFRGAEEIKLRPKSFEVLKHLVENHGRLVGKDKLIEAVWPNTAVTDDSLVQCLIEVRRALGNGGNQIVKTVPRRGYIFDAEVRKHGADEQVMVYTEEVEGVVLELDKDELVSDRRNIANSFPERGTSRPRILSRKLVYLSLVCATLVLTGMFLVYKKGVTRREGQVSPIHSLAVLPLENLSGDPAQEYFADGMTEELISNLAHIKALKVISRTSVMGYKGIHKSLPEIARELNVDAVIEGTVQRSGGRVRVTTKLIYAATDAHLWARDYERDLTDVLKLQSEVAREVADEIRIQVSADELARLGSARSVNPQAHEAYLLGRYHFSKGNGEGWKQASEYFERAIEVAPDYAAAHAGLADAWQQQAIFGTKPFKEAELPARTAALRAVGLDGQLGEAHISLGNVKLCFDWDWAGAEAEFQRAVELDPGSVRAHITYGHLLMALGRHDEAIREGQIAVQLDPLSSETQSGLGRFLHRARRYEEAVPHLKRAVELEPGSVPANARLGDTYTQLGRYDEALAAFGRNGLGSARVYALMGKQRQALQTLHRLNIPWAFAINIAGVYVALGDRDEAFKVLEKAVGERNSFIIYLKEDPPLEDLHSDPRWKVLLQRMNFPSA